MSVPNRRSPRHRKTPTDDTSATEETGDTPDPEEQPGPMPGARVHAGRGRCVHEARSQAAGSGTVGRQESVDQHLVYVICPFTDDFEPVFAAIRTAARAVHLRAERVSDVPGDGRITDQMLGMIRRAGVIVADLTHERPNVYFELGYARGLDKRIITISRSGTKIHFNVRDWPYIEYFDSRPLEKDLRTKLRHAIQAT